MPDEPNKPMDELLKSYASKRREAAREPPELHPATRKMLRTEAARLFGHRQAGQGYSPVLWSGIRPAFAFAFVFAVLVAGASIWLWVREPRTLELARNVEPEMIDHDRLAQQPSEPAPTRDELLPRERATQTAKAAAPLPAVTASASKAGAYGGADGMAAGKQASANEEKMSANTSIGKSGKAREMQTVSGSMVAANWQTTQTQQYSRRNARDTVSETANAASLDNVLSNFQVQQVNNSVQIIDADGSTYTGIVVSAEENEGIAAANANARVAGQTVQTAANNNAQNTLNSRPVLKSLPQQSVQGSYFRATGVNRSLNQKVVFEGNFYAVTNAVQYQFSRTQAPAAAQAPGQNLLNNARIQGRAVVGDKDEIAIDAVPVEK